MTLPRTTPAWLLLPLLTLWSACDGGAPTEPIRLLLDGFDAAGEVDEVVDPPGDHLLVVQRADAAPRAPVPRVSRSRWTARSAAPALTGRAG